MVKVGMLQGFVGHQFFLWVKYKDMIWPPFIRITAGSMAIRPLFVALLFQHSADMFTDKEKVNWKVCRGLLFLLTLMLRTSQEPQEAQSSKEGRKIKFQWALGMSIIGTHVQAAQPVREYWNYPWKEIIE